MNWTSISGFRLVTADAARLVRFYAALGFAAQDAQTISPAQMQRLGLAGGGRRQTLTRGETRIDLDTFEVAGRSYPGMANAADIIFQHFALVTDDIGAAWSRAQAAGAVPISRNGPITLPASSGNVTAVKFRDPEGHPLEFLQFPKTTAAAHVTAIDHSAIAVADGDASRQFYEGMGLRVGDATLNQGPTQAALDGLDEATVDVVPLLPATAAPHLELLSYRHPRGRADGSARLWAVNDIAATRIVWRAGRDALVRDPDGHLHELAY